ncbi:MAG: alanine racemase [Oscillibacter sp.]|nr:alanine racemase [Oscillibacter sp.]
MNLTTSRCWAEIDLAALRDNCAQLHRLLPEGGRLMNILKANAYGHGALPVARALAEAFPEDWMGVACLSEALELREAGIRQEILILGPTPAEAAPVLAEKRITQALISPSYAEALAKCAAEAGVVVPCHLKVDSGMTRIGYLAYGPDFEQTMEAAEAAYRNEHLRVTGIFTHFSSSYLRGEEDDAYTEQQFRRFMAVCEGLRERGIDPGLRHCCNSASTVNSPEYALDMCRTGTVLYGLLPETVKRRPVPFRPVMTWKARVAMLRPAPEGTSVSYNRLAVAERDMTLAVISAGDADGYFRQLTNRGKVRIRGHVCPVVGRVCMDMFMVDVTDFPDIREGDEVILLGGGEEGVPCEWLYKPLDSGPSSITCSVRQRVQYIYLNE